MPSIVDTSPTVSGRELVVLDPVEEATGRVEFDITDWINQAGVDWGDAQIEQYLAQATLGQLPVDFRIPNRQIQIPLLLLDRSAATFDTVRRSIQEKVGLFQREGGWLKRDTVVGPLYADIVGASLKLSGGNLQVMYGIDADAVLTLEALPDFYGDEIALGDHTAAAASELLFTETGILGDLPGRVRIVVDEDSGHRQRGLIAAIRSRNYSAAPTAAVVYEAEDLTPVDAAAVAALADASGGDVVRHSSLSTGWTPVLSTELAGVGSLTHTGSYRVWARVYSTSDSPPQVRFLWDVGDLINPEENTAQTLPAASNFYLVDLGEIRIDRAPVGTHRWSGQIQAKGDAGGENISIDKLWLVPHDEYSARLSVPDTFSVGLAAYAARDEFNHSIGNLTGKTLPAGGTWAGAGDANDFAVATQNFDATDLIAQRQITPSDSTDSSMENGRYAIAGTSTFTDSLVRADVASVTGSTSGWEIGTEWHYGLLLRYIDTSNWLKVVRNTYQVGEPEKTKTLKIIKSVAGVVTELASVTPPIANDPDYWTLQVFVSDSGRVVVWWAMQGAPLNTPVMTVEDADFATGGPLASGKVGIYDAITIVGAPAGIATTKFDNFAASVPDLDAVLFPSRALEMRTDGVYRQNSDGAGYGQLTPIGDLPRLPPSGLEGRTIEVLIKQSRGDLDELPDSGIDDISASVYYRPSYLFTPDEDAAGS